MITSTCIVSIRGVRSLIPHQFNAPWPFVSKVRGQRKIGPVKYEKWKIPGQQREIPELSPKFQKLNLEQLKEYTGVQPTGYVDPVSKKFVSVKEMIPELVVPDLTNFPLRPYVSFKTDVEIEKRRKNYEKIVRDKGSEEVADLYVNENERWPPHKITAKRLFDLCYAPKIRYVRFLSLIFEKKL
ncbi:unnamed protein product [Dracunculus medinensis]|uniref:39S ribosomal protein L41, mitochondrial n=1 Tax=Dracunculus medinensis TaxID=318479 RepID=A0A0N4U8E0_DRAME|nr:unnamed protein product [Dracunculus medinensis]